MQHKILIRSLLISLVLALVIPGTSGQSAPAILPAASGEEVFLFTDRDLYATSEQILFTAFYSGPGDEAGNELSQVLYVELIRWNGKKIGGKKVFIENGKAQGSIIIPAELESGNYYLRAYTKWMRNYSPYLYSYELLKVVNPGTSLTETGPDENMNPIEPISMKCVSDMQDQLRFSGLKEKYGTRQLVDMQLDLSPGFEADHYFFEVVRKGTKEDSTGSFSFQPPETGEPGPGIQYPSDIRYFPEIRDLSLTGKVVGEEGNQPAGGVRVNLSTVAEPMYFSTTLTDANGTFIFTFPDIRGDHEFHIAAEDASGGELELLIDNDFCNRPVTLPYHGFYLTEDEKGLVRELTLNAQIQSRFGITSVQPVARTVERYPFYGAPDRTIYEKEYIELKNLEEFLYELVYEVGVRRTNGKASIQMRNPGTLVGYPPLVLMDNIRIDNIDELLAVSCRRVERIEVVNRGYVIGNHFYSGILSFYSEEHDMAGMKLGEENNFFILSLPEREQFSFPEYVDGNDPTHLPDRRNTLAWDPSIDLGSGSSFSTSFYTPDAPGTYTIRLTGVNVQDGTLVCATREIVVGNQ